MSIKKIQQRSHEFQFRYNFCAERLNIVAEYFSFGVVTSLQKKVQSEWTMWKMLPFVGGGF
jgi:hypothetical protein